MSRRAEQIEETRQRIVAAAVALHGSVGPANTTIAEIAEAAGVTRLTVYRHFPDGEALFEACSAQWAAGQRLPDVDAWLRETRPEARLRTGLRDLYRFYDEAEAMLELVTRDQHAIPQSLRDSNAREERARIEAIVAAWPTRQRTRRRRALVGHAAAFSTWRSLCREQGLSQKTAVDCMVRLVTAP
jgi:AcrR family transcriptional regulator